MEDERAVVDLDRLERLLIAAARERRPVTYGQLLAFFERRLTPITVRALCRDLGRVESRRQGAGWPDLACLVVRRSDGLPGEGYFESLRREGAYAGPSTGPVAEEFLRARQAQVYRWAEQLDQTGTVMPGAGSERAEHTRPGEAYRDDGMSAASRSM